MYNPTPRYLPARINRETCRKLSYCYVRLRGRLRDTTIKVFFEDDVLMQDFKERINAFGDIRSVQFPIDQAKFTYDEVFTANNEHRLLLSREVNE